MKKFEKKLSLVKETVSNLEKETMQNVVGGLESQYENDTFLGTNAWYTGSRNSCYCGACFDLAFSFNRTDAGVSGYVDVNVGGIVTAERKI